MHNMSKIGYELVLGGYQERGENLLRFQAGFHLAYLKVSPRVMPFLKPIKKKSLG